MTQPEALRLADWCDTFNTVHHDKAAAELRRLHEENERLHQINQFHKMKLSVRGYEIQIADLEAVNAKLLNALIYMLNVCPAIDHQGEEAHQKARAAIAKAEAA
jgi:hypothetical protein